MDNDKIERYLRKQTTCVCGKHKDRLNIVCWNCFKRTNNPLKWFSGTIEQWLIAINRRDIIVKAKKGIEQ